MCIKQDEYKQLKKADANIHKTNLSWKFYQRLRAEILEQDKSELMTPSVQTDCSATGILLLDVITLQQHPASWKLSSDTAELFLIV